MDFAFLRLCSETSSRPMNTRSSSSSSPTSLTLIQREEFVLTKAQTEVPECHLTCSGSSNSSHMTLPEAITGLGRTRVSDWPVLDDIFSLDLNTDLIRITQTESRGEPLLERGRLMSFMCLFCSVHLFSLLCYTGSWLKQHPAPIHITRLVITAQVSSDTLLNMLHHRVSPDFPLWVHVFLFSYLISLASNTEAGTYQACKKSLRGKKEKRNTARNNRTLNLKSQIPSQASSLDLNVVLVRCNIVT